MFGITQLPVETPLERAVAPHPTRVLRNPRGSYGEFFPAPTFGGALQGRES